MDILSKIGLKGPRDKERTAAANLAEALKPVVALNPDDISFKMLPAPTHLHPREMAIELKADLDSSQRQAVQAALDAIYQPAKRAKSEANSFVVSAKGPEISKSAFRS